MKNPLAPKEPKGREKIEHYNAILIEELTSQFKFVTEHMMSIEERLAKKMDDKFGQVDSRFDIIEKTLENHSDRLNTVENVLVEFKRESNGRFDQIENRLGSVENRLGSVENQLGSVENRLGSVENRLGGIEDKTDTIEHVLLEFKHETNEHFEKLEHKIVIHDRDIGEIKTTLALS